MIEDLSAISAEVESPCFGPLPVQHVVLMGPQRYPTPRPLLCEDPALVWTWLASWHQSPRLPSPRRMNCYFIENLVLVGHDTPVINGEVVVSPDALPLYRARQIQDGHLGAVEKALALPRKEIDGPCFPLAADGNVYGHFIIEALGRLHIAQRMLRGALPPFKVLVIRTLPRWARNILTDAYGIPQEDLVEYDPDNEHVLLRQAIWPALAMCGDQFHPYAGHVITDLLSDLRVGGGLKLDRLFLTRAFFHNPAMVPRIFGNEAEITEIAAREYGFFPVAPECMPWIEQLRLFANARVVVGRFGSGLHNTLFSRRNTRIGVLGFGNLVQSGISALRAQRLCYITNNNDAVPYMVEPDQFRRMIDVLLQDSSEREAA